MVRVDIYWGKYSFLNYIEGGFFKFHVFLFYHTFNLNFKIYPLFRSQGLSFMVSVDIYRVKFSFLNSTEG